MKGTYEHFKGEKYDVVGEAIHTENDEEMVIYHHESQPERLFVRPKEMFNELVDIDDRQVPRFKKIEKL